MNFFSKPKPVPFIVIRDRLGREIDRVQGWNLERKDLRNKNWQHVDLRNQCLDGSDLSGTNMLGADLRGASLRYCNLAGCEISYADTSRCDFTGCNMAGSLLYRSETQEAKFHNVLLDVESDIPKIKVFQPTRASL